MSRPSIAYEPRAPAQDALYQIVRDHFETFRAEAASLRDEEGLPRLVEDEFRAFLRCGWLAGGFARFRCASCGFDRLVAFSCKGRGFCPSCGGRRMAERAAHLVDDVFPGVPVRQWVLSLPLRLRDDASGVRSDRVSRSAGGARAAAADQSALVLRGARRPGGMAAAGGGAPGEASESAPAATSAPSGEPAPKAASRGYLWAELMQRTFTMDVLACPRCGGRLRLVALIEQAAVVARMLGHLGLPTEVPAPRRSRSPAGRPCAWLSECVLVRGGNAELCLRDDSSPGSSVWTAEKSDVRWLIRAVSRGEKGEGDRLGAGIP